MSETVTSEDRLNKENNFEDLTFEKPCESTHVLGKILSMIILPLPPQTAKYLTSIRKAGMHNFMRIILDLLDSEKMKYNYMR